jgi:hypothetical protein
MAALLLSSCNDRSSSSRPLAPESGPVVVEATNPLRDAARNVNSYMVTYGPLDATTIRTAQTYQLVIVHPTSGNLTRSQVAAIQGGTDPADPSKRVLVLGYISVGEDLRTASLTDQQLRADSRFIGDGTGPRMDPRGPTADGQPLTGIDPLGLPSNGGTGFASWYLDDNSVHNSANLVGDGIPDRNGVFNACYANAGDPKWFDVLQKMTMDGVDGVAGLGEILTTTYGRGLGCDGVFMDTFDTCGPNAWTSAASPAEAKFEWTAPGFQAFVQRLRITYPDRVILQNRGLFFYNPVLPHYAFTTRGLIDLGFFESYRLNSGSTNNPDPVFYPDNRYNYAPKIMAEANRPDGFRMLSLGYAEGPADQMSEQTLVGGSTLGYDSLLEDIRVTQNLAGFRHYLTDRSVTLVNTFVRDHADLSDTSPPVWTSTYNDHAYPSPAGPPTPRVGIQQVVAGTGSVTVRWDVALDLSRVRYALYYKTSPFDFSGDPNLISATRLVLSPSIGNGYVNGVGPGVYPYEATVSGLTPGQTYYFVIRAFDDSPAANEEKNQNVLSAVPAGTTGTTDYLGRWRASNGTSTVTYRFQFTNSWDWSRAYVDIDRTAGTGFNYNGIGADFLIENGQLYRYTGTGSTWAWQAVSPNPVSESTGPVDGMTFVQWDMPLGALGETRDTNLLFQVERPGVMLTGYPYRDVYTSTDPTSPILGYYAENDQTKIYYHAQVNQPFAWTHVFIDSDNAASTGFPIGGIGADYLIENGYLFQYSAAPPAWGWQYIGLANLVQSGSSFDWTILRTDIQKTGVFDQATLLFQGNGGSPAPYAAPVYVHAFSP